MNDENGNGHWTVSKALSLYQIPGWGAPYFGVNPAGQVEVRPDPERDGAINLFDLTEELKTRGLDLPLLIRFSDIVAHRIRRINECFQKAIAEYEYAGGYRGVFPVKVNQQRHLVEEVVEFGRRLGLRAGGGLQAGALDRPGRRCRTPAVSSSATATRTRSTSRRRWSRRSSTRT